VKFYFGGGEIPSHRNLLTAENMPHVALSYMGLRRRTKFTKPWLAAEVFGDDQSILLDSGCHTLNREGVEVDHDELRAIADHYYSLIEANIDRLDAYTEFDALALGHDWIKNNREHLHPDKAIVVWHEEYGLDELRRMADQHPYVAVGQATCGDRDIIPVLRSLARQGRLHGMGFSSPPLMLAADWYSIASTTWLSAAQHGETFVWTGTELKRYPTRYKAQARKRHRSLFTDAGLDADKIEADDPTEVLRLSLWSWTKQIEHISRRHGDPATVTPIRPHLEIAETTAGAPTGTHPEDSLEPATIRREKRLLPGIEQERFTYRYTDPETGEKTSRQETRLHAVDPDVRVCDGCFLANKCRDYQPGHSCVYEIPIRVRTKEQYIALLDGVIAMQGARVMFMRVAEEVEGGYADPNLSQEMDRLAKYIKLKADIEEAGFTFSMKIQQKDGAQVGLLSRLFGDKAGGPPALTASGTVSAQQAIEQMGIVDAEVVE
jgi:hypothetical protein